MWDGDEDMEDEIAILDSASAASDHPYFEDYVAERTYSFSLLITTVAEIEDEGLRELGTNMLQAIIRTISSGSTSISAVTKK